MADPTRGRGRGLALLQALKKAHAGMSSDEASPESTPETSAAPTVAPSVVGTASSFIPPSVSILYSFPF